MSSIKKTKSAILAEARKSLLEELVETGALSISMEGIASNADRDSKASRDIALHIV